MNRSSRIVASSMVIALAGLVLSGTARAQVIYEPVRYQYHAYGKAYYYGGNDPAMFRFAARRAYFERFVRYGRHPFSNYSGFGGNHVLNGDPGVYMDFLPWTDAGNYGFTAADARNDAMSRVPLYFRKSDLLDDATVDRDGAVIVPATPPQLAYPSRARVEIRRYVRPTTRPSSTQGGRIIIIPKKAPLSAPAKTAPLLAAGGRSSDKLQSPAR